MEVIYVGGDQSLADLYKLKLEVDGYSVTLAPTGTAGLDQARGRIPDIVFLDLSPADQSLLHMLRTMRRDPDLKNVPAVLLWRDDADVQTIQALQLGVKDFLVQANRSQHELAWSDLSDGPPEFRYVH